jgi:hypothetical protein
MVVPGADELRYAHARFLAKHAGGKEGRENRTLADYGEAEAKRIAGRVRRATRTGLGRLNPF